MGLYHESIYSENDGAQRMALMSLTDTPQVPHGLRVWWMLPSGSHSLVKGSREPMVGNVLVSEVVWVNTSRSQITSPACVWLYQGLGRAADQVRTKSSSVSLYLCPGPPTALSFAAE